LLDLFSNQLRALFSVRNALRRFFTCTVQCLLRTLFSDSHRSLTLIGRSQSIRDSFGTLIQRIIQRWKYELHREPDQHREGDHLPMSDILMSIPLLLTKSFS